MTKPEHQLTPAEAKLLADTRMHIYRELEVFTDQVLTEELLIEMTTAANVGLDNFRKDHAEQLSRARLRYITATACRKGDGVDVRLSYELWVQEAGAPTVVLPGTRGGNGQAANQVAGRFPNLEVDDE